MRLGFKRGKRLVAILVVAVMAFGTAACGGENKPTKVGVMQFADHPSLDNCRKGFIQGLEQEGYKDGENIEIEFKSAQGSMDIATQISQSFVSDKKKLVCGIATPSAQSLYALCVDKKIPVIFNAVSDPISAKLATSKTQPMKGITGVSDQLPVEAQLQLIKQVLPKARKIGILYTTSEDNSVSTIETYKKFAPDYGFEIVAKGIGNESEIPQALDILLKDVDCISNLTDNTVVQNLAIMLEKANEKNIPVFGSEEEQVKNGCIGAAGLDYVQLGIQAGIMAGRVLKGEDITKIPFETLKDSKITLNKKVAATLNVTFSASVIESAQVIE